MRGTGAAGGLLLLALAGCVDADGERAVAVASPSPPAPAGVAAPAPPPGPSVAVAPPAEFERYPALAAAVRAAADAEAARFRAQARAAQAAGDVAAPWALRIEWRVLRGNRYLWVAEGEGEAVRGDRRTPVQLRLAYDGIGKRVLAFGDWFEPAAWPRVAEVVGTRLRGTPAAADPARLRTLAYEPVFSAEGPVIRFDLLPGDAGDGAQRRVPLPLDLVAPWIADDRRVLLDAAAAGP